MGIIVTETREIIYLDNAATSFPKPCQVIEAVTDCMEHHGANPGRGAHSMSLEASRIIFETRERMAAFLGAQDSADVVFTKNATEALNIGLKGFVRASDHIVTTSMEHNSVARPIEWLVRLGVKLTKVQCSPEGVLDPEDVDRAIRADTRLIAVTHASNVTGTIMPIEAIAKIASKHGIPVMVDAAQTAGVLPIDVGALGVDMVAFSGHKGMLGPQGTGVLYISPDLDLREMMQGGTGSESESIRQPVERPERFECGTPNTLGIAGLGAALEFLGEVGLDAVRAREVELTARLLGGFRGIPAVTVYGPGDAEARTAIVSINIDGMDSSQAAFLLDKNYRIAVRSGLHCAPEAHRTLGTLTPGTVRFSIGYFNTAEDVDAAIKAVAEIAGRDRT